MKQGLSTVITRSTEEDVDQVMAVQNAAFRSDFEKYGICPSYIPDRDAFVDKIRVWIVYKIALKDGQVVGGIEIHPRNDFHYHLHTISVLPEHQNKGIGTQAIEFMFRNHPEPCIWSLVTPSDNPLTRHLYEKMGFVLSGETSAHGVSLVVYERLARP